MPHYLTLLVLLLLANGPCFAQRSAQQTNAADTAMITRLVQDLRATSGTDHYNTLVDSLGNLAKQLAKSSLADVRARAAEGRVQYHRFAAWRAALTDRMADVIHHADTVDMLLGDRHDREALIMRRACNRARNSVYHQLQDTARLRQLHLEDMRISTLLHDTIVLLDAHLQAEVSAAANTMNAGEVFARTCIAQGSDSVAGRAKWYLGRMLWSSGRHAEAIPLTLSCRSFALDAANHAWHPPMYHSGLAYCYLETGSTKTALQHYDSCMTVALEADIQAWYCSCAKDKAAVLRSHGDPDGAFRLDRAAYDTAQVYGLLGHVVGQGRSVADHLRLLGKWQEALAVTEAYHAAQDSLDNAASGRALAVALFQGQVRADSIAHTAELAVQSAEVRRQRVFRNGALGGSALLALSTVTFLFQRVRISREKQRSDELLLNILPAEVAEELKSTGAAEARHIEHATILFTDFKGFTEASEQLTPQELVEELDTCFKAFDAIITKRGIEKIKTIGDAYMAAGGLRRQAPSGVADVVHAALDMQEFMVRRKLERTTEGKPAFEMRVGIHTGPVVAGIVGVKKFQYDIWGDTVNTANRMESSGEVGQVNISASTYHELASQSGWSFTPRGLVSAKGKGQLDMFFVRRSSERA